LLAVQRRPALDTDRSIPAGQIRSWPISDKKW